MPAARKSRAIALLIPASSSTTTIDWCLSATRAFMLYNPISSRTSILRNSMKPAENLAEVKSGRYCTLVQEREVRGTRVEGRGLGFLGSGVRFDSKDSFQETVFFYHISL